jgi:hypothetical protein
MLMDLFSRDLQHITIKKRYDPNDIEGGGPPDCHLRRRRGEEGEGLRVARKEEGRAPRVVGSGGGRGQAMAMAAAGAKAGVDALAMAMAAVAGMVTTSALPASVAFGDNRVVREILDPDDARRARDNNAEAGVNALAMAIAAAGAEVAFGDDRVVGEILDADDARRARDDDKARWERGMRTCAHNNQTDQSAFFVVGDASGKGKGNAVIEQYGVDYELGAWNLEWREKSSNFREAENLTD